MLAYQTLGEGRQTIVLVHGFLGAGRNVLSLARRLVALHPNLHVLLPDLPGHGASPPVAGHVGLADMAQAVLDLAATLRGPAPITFVGHSLGGRVAMAALALAPERLAHVAVLDIAPGPAPSGHLGADMQRVVSCLAQAPASAPSRAAMRDFFLAANVAAPLANWVVTNGQLTGETFIWRIDRAALLALQRRTSAEDLWPRVRAWSRRRPAPPRVTVVRGGASDYVDDAQYAALAAAGCRTATLPGIGHFVHVDAGEALMPWLI